MKYKKGIILGIAIASFLAFNAIQLQQQTIYAKMLANLLVPYDEAAIDHSIQWNDNQIADLIREHVCELCDIEQRKEGLDEVLDISRCLKKNTTGRYTQSVPNPSFDYLRFFAEDAGVGNPVRCGINVSLLHNALASLGYKARRIDLSQDQEFSKIHQRFVVNFFNSSTSPPFDRHSALEYFDIQLKKWIFVDIHYGYIVRRLTSQDNSGPDTYKPPLSAKEIQDAYDDIVLVPIHEWSTPYTTDKYAGYFSQVAIGLNYNPFIRLRALRDEFGNSYRSFCKRHRDKSRLYQWLNWEYRDGCQQ